MYGHDFGLFFFNDSATTEIYTLSLHDALPIFSKAAGEHSFRKLRDADSVRWHLQSLRERLDDPALAHARIYCLDRKSTRLNSSHANISYAAFCLKKKTESIDYSITSSIHETPL